MNGWVDKYIDWVFFFWLNIINVYYEKFFLEVNIIDWKFVFLINMDLRNNGIGVSKYWFF